MVSVFTPPLPKDSWNDGFDRSFLASTGEEGQRGRSMIEVSVLCSSIDSSLVSDEE